MSKFEGESAEHIRRFLSMVNVSINVKNKTWIYTIDNYELYLAFGTFLQVKN
jgi:hypothetical protein